MSKLGVHVFIGPRIGYGPFLKKIAEAGQTLAVVKCVDDFGAAAEAKGLMPGTLTVGRLNSGRDAVEQRDVDLQGYEPLNPDGSYQDARKVAEWYFGLVQAQWEANRKWIDVWETFNEFSAHWGWQGDFFLAMMDIAEVNGYKLAHYACSTGNPPNAAAAREMIPCLKESKKRGHYLSLHEYGGVGTDVMTLKGTEPFHALRYRALYETILIPNDADAPLIISECAQSGGSQFPGTDILIEDFKWYDDQLMQDPYVAGAAVWTLGRTVLWPEANIQDALPALGDYISRTPARPAGPRQPGGGAPVFGGETKPAPPEPPKKVEPAARPRGAPRAPYKRTYLLLPNEPATAEGNQRLEGWIQAVVASGVLARHRWTMGTSADDAGIGDLDKRSVIAINPETWPTSLADFYAVEYPGVHYESIEAATPEDLRTRLANLSFG